MAKCTEFVAGQKFFDEGEGHYVIVKSVSTDKIVYDGYYNYKLVQPDYSYTPEQFIKWVNRKKDSPERKAARRLVVNANI